jgi:putative endonuclease
MFDLVAQLVEHNTFNVGAQGSNPCGITKALNKTQSLFYAIYLYPFSEKLSKYYIGACINLERRLYEHNISHSKFTSNGVPWKVVYTEEYPTLAEAKKREKQIKSMKSRKYIEGLILKSKASRF